MLNRDVELMNEGSGELMFKSVSMNKFSSSRGLHGSESLIAGCALVENGGLLKNST